MSTHAGARAPAQSSFVVEAPTHQLGRLVKGDYAGRRLWLPIGPPTEPCFFRRTGQETVAYRAGEWVWAWDYIELLPVFGCPDPADAADLLPDDAEVRDVS